MASFRGFFGKLPARGDFVSAGPPRDFVSRWDTWVSSTLPAALAAAGEDWMEAPAKRIRFAPGVYAADTVTGVVLPSVDIDSAERLGHTAITEAMPPDVLARRLANIPPRGHTAAISPVMYDAVAFTIMMTGGPAMTTDLAIQATDDRFGRIRCTTATHPGIKRSHNEDALLSRPDLGLWVVADGAGGHSRGQVAARTVVAALDAIPPNLTAAEMLAQVRLRLAGAHHALREESARIQQRLVASTVVALIARDDHFACLWAGDSRAYLMRQGSLGPLTVDHSLVQDLLDQGAIDPAGAEQHPQGHIITRAIGADDAQPELDKTIGNIMPGDQFLLCSDGLCKTLVTAELAQLLRADASAEQIVAAALARDVSDNVTGLTIHFQHDLR